MQASSYRPTVSSTTRPLRTPWFLLGYEEPRWLKSSNLFGSGTVHIRYHKYGTESSNWWTRGLVVVSSSSYSLRETTFWNHIGNVEVSLVRYPQYLEPAWPAGALVGATSTTLTHEPDAITHYFNVPARQRVDLNKSVQLHLVSAGSIVQVLSQAVRSNVKEGHDSAVDLLAQRGSLIVREYKKIHDIAASFGTDKSERMREILVNAVARAQDVGPADRFRLVAKNLYGKNRLLRFAAIDALVVMAGDSSLREKVRSRLRALDSFLERDKTVRRYAREALEEIV